MNMVRHYLQCHSCPAIPCTNPVESFLNNFLEWIHKNFHPCLWNPDKVIVYVVDAVPCFSYSCNLNLCIVCNPEMLPAVCVCSILLQLVYNLPVCICCHFFLRQLRRQRIYL